MRLRLLLSACALAVLGACGDAALPTAAAPSAEPSAEISHWPTWGTRGFYFLPYDPPAGEVLGAFDPTLSPVVRVCRVTNGTCGPTLATFTRTSGSYGRLVTVDAPNQAYDLTWPTGSTGVQPGQVYRVSVTVGTRELGFMDVYFVTSFWEYFFVDTDAYVPWFAGLNLAVSFRIEEDVPGTLSLSATSLTMNVGEARTVTASVLDLAGQPLGGEIGCSWRPTRRAAATWPSSTRRGWWGPPPARAPCGCGRGT